MPDDHYRISSNFRRGKRSSESNVKEFFEGFENFYTKFLMKENPDLKHKICDPYGFALLCEDYKPDKEIKSDENPTCQEAFSNSVITKYDSLFKHEFPFKVLLDLLYHAYYFDYDLAIEIYKMQRNPLHIFKQIMNGQGYVANKMKPNKREVGKLMNYAYNSRITLEEKKEIKVPFKHRVCDGKSWPCIVSESFIEGKIIKDETDGFGEGIFIVNEKNHVFDCLKINDLWLVDTPLENRLEFCFHSRNYKTAKYMKCFSWRSALTAGRVLNCNKTEGILIRPCSEDYFTNSWFEWSRNSLIYCCKIKGNLQVSNRKKSKPDFYTLEGEIGNVNPFEERVYERIWLDDFDIKEFQQILTLEDK